MQFEVIGDRYQLQDPIGRGGMATIYRARDVRMDRVVAVKVLREVYSTDPKFVRRFQVEAKAASALQHPNIVQVYDYGQTDGNYYIVMELVEGTDLRRYLRSRGVLDVDRAIIIAHDVALGLGAAHRRDIVHRDVKPQNVLVGGGGSIKLTDFGIASVYKDMNAERLTTTGMTLGTVQYYAPEQAQGQIVSPAADVYALGIVMYEMVTGHPPFDGDSPVAVAMQHIQDVPTPPSHLNPNLSPALEEIILRCLEKVPEMRFRDGSQLARALESLGESELEETVAPLTPGHTRVPITYNQIPPRPSSSGRTSPLWVQQSAASASPPMTQTPAVPEAFATPSQPPVPVSLLKRAFSGVRRMTGRRIKESQLSLFAIARANLEVSDRAYVNQIYFIEAGISESKPANFRAEPFDVTVSDPLAPLTFDILIHVSDNIKLQDEWHKRITYYPFNPATQLVQFRIRIVATGHSSFSMDYYHERRWLRTVRLEFEAVEQSQLSTASSRV
jgi:serine/threonine protein kinase